MRRILRCSVNPISNLSTWGRTVDVLEQFRRDGFHYLRESRLIRYIKSAKENRAAFFQPIIDQRFVCKYPLGQFNASRNRLGNERCFVCERKESHSFIAIHLCLSFLISP